MGRKEKRGEQTRGNVGILKRRTEDVEERGEDKTPCSCAGNIPLVNAACMGEKSL